MYIHYSPNQIAIRWTIYRGFSKLPEDFTRAKVVCMLTSSDNRFPVNVDVAKEACGQHLLVTVPAGLPEGVYAIEAIWTKNEFRSVARSRHDAVLAVTTNPEESTDHGAATTATILNIRSSAATFGYDGLSAYELALLKGMVTTDENTWVQNQIDTAIGTISEEVTDAITCTISQSAEQITAQAEADITEAKDTAVAEATELIEGPVQQLIGDLTGGYLHQKANHLYLGIEGGIKYDTGLPDNVQAVHRTDKIKLSPGDIIVARGYVTGVYSAITVYDSEGAIIEKVQGASPSGATALQATHIYIATSEADTAVISIATGKSPGYVYGHLVDIDFYHPALPLDHIDSELRDRGEAVIDTDLLTWNTGNYTCTGETPGYKFNTPSLQVCAPIQVKAVPTIRISGMISSKAIGVNFFDKQLQSLGYDVQDNCTFYNTREPRLVSLPEQTEYIVFSRYIDQQTRGKAQLSLITQDKTDKLAPKSSCQLFSPFSQTVESFNAANPQTPLTRLPLFGKEADPYTTQGHRRCPALCVTNAGTFLALTCMADSDKDNAEYSILLARKTQQNDSWTYSVPLPFDDTNKIKYMNEAFCIDRTGAHGTEGRIYLFAIKLTINEDALSTSRNDGFCAYASTDDIDTVYIYSDDDGQTWSQQHSTKTLWDTDTYRSAWPGPASGTQLADGTLVMPAEFIAGFQNSDAFATKKTNITMHSGILYKKPGEDWQFLPNMHELHNNEDFVIEGATPNTILLNCRNESDRHKRKLYIVDTTEGTFTQIDHDFDPWVNCQQTGQKCTIGGKTVYLLSANDQYKDVPAIHNINNKDRARMTVWTSKDGIHWMRALLADPATGWGYSAIASYAGVTGIVYEKTTPRTSRETDYNHIAFIDLTPANQLLLDNIEIADTPLEQRLALLRETVFI